MRRSDVDMSPAAVTRRLQEVSGLRDLRRQRRRQPDMSAVAVTARLRQVSQLRDLCLALRAR